MTSEHPDDLARLSEHARAPERSRLRLGVGAAIVLLIAALMTAVLVSALAQPASTHVGAGGGATVPAEAFSQAPEATASAAPTIFVHVLGAVRTPGLFDLPAGSRVMDAVAHAGGVLETADPTGVNLARLLVDGEQLYVPQVGESPPDTLAGAAVGGAGAPGAPGAMVNINTGSLSDLDTLPHVGPVMAQRIIDYRTSNGRFTSVEDLRNVTGVGEKTFEALRDLVTT